MAKEQYRTVVRRALCQLEFSVSCYISRTGRACMARRQLASTVDTGGVVGGTWDGGGARGGEGGAAAGCRALQASVHTRGGRQRGTTSTTARRHSQTQQQHSRRKQNTHTAKRRRHHTVPL